MLRQKCNFMVLLFFTICSASWLFEWRSAEGTINGCNYGEGIPSQLISWFHQDQLISSRSAVAFKISWRLQDQLTSSRSTDVFDINCCLQHQLLSSTSAVVFNISYCLQDQLLFSKSADVTEICNFHFLGFCLYTPCILFPY